MSLPTSWSDGFPNIVAFLAPTSCLPIYWHVVQQGCELELGNNMVVLFLNFQGACIMFSIVAAPIYVPANGAPGFPFLHILTTISFVFSMIAILTV